MSEITMQELNDLQEQKAIYEKQLSALDINNPIHAIERSALTDEINVVSNKISEKKWEMQQKEAQIEEKIHADDIPFAVAGVDFTKLPPEFITLMDLVNKADRRRIYKEVDADNNASKKSHDAEIEALNGQIVNLESSNDALTATNADILAYTAKQDDTIAQQIRLITDLTSKLANAAAQLDEKDAEIKRLNSELDDYQKAKVFGERESQNIVEVEQSEADAINAAIQKIYVSADNWGSIVKVNKPDGTYELVKNKDMHEWVPETEVANTSTPFPGESGQTAEADVENGGVPDSGAITPPQLPFPALSNGDTAVEGQSAHGDMVAKELTIIERITGLEERVKRLEQGSEVAA